METSVKIFKDEMRTTLERLFSSYKCNDDVAHTLAKVFTENSLCGVNSHGINRVPLFIEYIKKGLVNVNAEAEKTECFSNIERWDGHSAPGITNAVTCTDSAIKLAKTHGMGIVALKNTNHWMRGGYYGWQAANAGCIGILFTNTKPNMPAWGGKDLRVGNNPFIIAIPRTEGHVVLDMAMSQFSFGKINDYKLKNDVLPHEGGWDKDFNLTRQPEAILDSQLSLPMGLWKGSAFAIVLDMLATLLANGNSTYKLGQAPYETKVSQVFLCIDTATLGSSGLHHQLLNEIIDFTHNSTPSSPNTKTYYPGERTLLNRNKNATEGISVNAKVWNTVLDLI